jgi:hypothetical protein
MSIDKSGEDFEHVRGDRGAYRRYLDGMDSSMRQKVALVAAHLRAQGRVADMGMGSGTGSHALAALYPSIDVIGVDLDPMMVELAAERYMMPNLSFKVGDIAKSVFEEGTLEGVIDSSVLHHVTSFTDYSYPAAAEALRVQSEQVAEHGVVIVRDFLAPQDRPVLLDLPADNGDEGEDVASCSTARLFERFATEFRLLHAEPGFPYEAAGDSEPGVRPGWRRYRVGLRMATEFVLRKDYRRDWSTEAKEEYCYFTQSEFEEVFGSLGLRVLASTPLRNPWIVNNRFKDKLALWTEEGEPLEFPATNFVIVGEKVAPGLGVAFREGASRMPLGFLQLDHYRHKQSGSIRDLVRRPHRTLDILPWFEVQGDFFVVARASYPRPMLQASCRKEHTLDGARAAGYVTEPLLVVQSDLPLGTTIEESLRAEAGIEAAQIRGFDKGTSYYPSPGGIEELVTSSLVEVEPTFVSRPLENRSGFSSAGRVMAIEAQQLLRSAQVGGLLDARLELNVYELLLQKAHEVGPWIGEEVDLAESSPPSLQADVNALLARKPRRAFERCQEESDFLDLRCSSFEEVDATGAIIHRADLEYVVPRHLSHNTLACALLRKHEGKVWMAVDDDDLPAAQSFAGNSQLLVTPAWRMPMEIRTLTPALAWTRNKIKEEYGVTVGRSWELGGRYHPSLGLTPEVVHPVAFEVQEEEAAGGDLNWVAIEDLIEGRARLQDGHLRIIALRAAHALGALDPLVN